MARGVLYLIAVIRRISLNGFRPEPDGLPNPVAPDLVGGQVLLRLEPPAADIARMYRLDRRVYVNHVLFEIICRAVALSAFDAGRVPLPVQG